MSRDPVTETVAEAASKVVARHLRELPSIALEAVADLVTAAGPEALINVVSDELLARHPREEERGWIFREAAWRLDLSLAFEQGAVLGPAASRPASLPLLPLSASATGATRVRWASGEPMALPALQALQRWLYGRPDAWPMRQAPPEWRALLALLANLLRPGPALQPDRLSLVPQQLAPDRCGPGNHSDRSPASAS
jgi:hypothetical protein